MRLYVNLDSELFVAMKYDTTDTEERRASNEALIVAANNEGNGIYEHDYGMNLGQTTWWSIKPTSSTC